MCVKADTLVDAVTTKGASIADMSLVGEIGRALHCNRRVGGRGALEAAPSPQSKSQPAVLGLWILE
jgi:hypothetical protein